MIRRRVLAAMTLVAALLLAGCTSSDSLAQQYRDGSEKGYIAGDFQIVEIPDADRGEPVVFEGVTETGETVSSDDYRGGVLVVNFWYAACAPCRVEAPHLVALHEQFAPQGVRFLGVNVRDTVTTAQAFERTFEIPYPSIEDARGDVLLNMTDYVPPQAVPSTLVLDVEGRVAARVLGAVEESTLRALLTTVVDEAAA